MKKTSKLLAVLLVIAMLASACGPANPGTTTVAPTQPATTEAAKPTTPQPTTPQPTTPQPTEPNPPTPIEETYTYNDYTTTLGANWNPHTYQTTDEAYTLDYTTDSLYQFLFNEDFNGYEIVPSMATEKPIDVTAEVKAAHPEFNIPEGATSGYAYKIPLNPKVCWNDGTPIKAQDYIDSLVRLMNPKAANYRSTDMLSGDLVLANIVNYFNQGTIGSTGVCVVSEAYGDDEYWDPSEVVEDENGYLTYNGQYLILVLDNGGSWGASLKDYESYMPEAQWTLLTEAAKDNNVILTAETLKALQDCIAVLHGAENVEAYAEKSGDYAYREFEEMVFWGMAYEDNYSFDNVGIIASGEYELTIALAKSLSGFYLLYNIGSLSTFLVKTDLYDSLLKPVNDTFTSTYGTSVETSVSFGPYMITEYQSGKYVQMEKNPTWWGWDSDVYSYVDPEDGETYQMYMTDIINCQVVEDSSTRLEMFLKGELATYGLQSQDMDTYRSSDYTYVTPGTTIFFFIFNGYKDMIQKREAADDFDKTKFDLETMTLESFRKAVAVSYDKELFCATVQPARSGGYGIIGKGYIYDPDTGAEYRETDVARQVLCDFYSVDVSKYDSLEEAAASITGYDPVAAKALYEQAFKEALEAGFITDADNDGKSDQTIEISYSASSVSDFMTKTINYLNEKMAEVTVGTPFEGKITFKIGGPYGDDWSDKIKNGEADTVLGGWRGSMMNPYSLITQYTNPSQAYDGKWFNGKNVKFTYTVNGEEITMSLYDWGECLNGTEVDGHNFGSDAADQDTRMAILAALEGEILKTYDYIPMIQDASMSLLSKKLFFVTEEYNAVMGRGGIAYMKYNYNDADWAQYVKDQGGTLQY